MREDTKLARIRDAMRNGDWDRALRLAVRFQRLGPQAEAIRRAANAVNNPAFYLQLGYNIEKLKADGITALIERFNRSWEAVGRSSEGGINKDLEE